MTEFTELKNKKAGSSEPLSMRDTQQIALEILHTVAQICEERNLRYYLVYGTLIGAVRHHGFIPWDDDVDIMMPRPDYDKLLEYLEDHIGEYPHLQVFNRKTCPDYPYMITRISDDRYEIRMENEKPFGMGVFIDIFPFDTVMPATQRWRLQSYAFTLFRAGNGSEPAMRKIRALTWLNRHVCFPVLRFLSKVARCKRVTFDYGIPFHKVHDKSDIFPLATHVFEGIETFVPGNYDRVLQDLYGDYMQLPSDLDNVYHHVERLEFFD